MLVSEINRISRTRALRRRRISMVGLTAILLVAFIGANSLTGYGSADSGNIFTQAAVTGVCIMLLAFTHVRNGWRRTMALPASLLIVFIYFLMSSIWALAPFISLRRLASTLMITWAVFRSANELGPTLALKALRNVSMALIVLSYLVLIFTSAGTHHGFDEPADLIGNWRGIFTHKNIAGEFLGVTIILLTFDPVSTSRRVRLGFLLAAAVFLWESRSKTAIGTVGLAMAIGWAMQEYHPRHLSRATIFLLLGTAIALPVASLYFGHLIAALEDPTGFSGRSDVWHYMLIYAQDHLWLGAGYGSFWQIGRDSPILLLASDWAADVGHGHNGYLDLLVTVGVPGLMLALLMVFIWPTILLVVDTTMPPKLRAWCTATTVFIFCDNLTETTLLINGSLQAVLMLVLAIIHRSADVGRRRPAAYSALGLDRITRYSQSLQGRPLVRFRR